MRRVREERHAAPDARSDRTSPNAVSRSWALEMTCAARAASSPTGTMMRTIPAMRARWSNGQSPKFRRLRGDPGRLWWNEKLEGLWCLERQLQTFGDGLVRLLGTRTCDEGTRDENCANSDRTHVSAPRDT